MNNRREILIAEAKKAIDLGVKVTICDVSLNQSNGRKKIRPWISKKCAATLKDINYFIGEKGHVCFDNINEFDKALSLESIKVTTCLAWVTGKDSGITVIDLDPKDNGDNNFYYLTAELSIPVVEWKTRMHLTGMYGKRRGRHLIFKYDADLKNTTGYLVGVDIRNDGGLIIAPPSVHPISSVVYCVDGDYPILPLPKQFVAYQETVGSGPRSGLRSMSSSSSGKPYTGKLPDNLKDLDPSKGRNDMVSKVVYKAIGLAWLSDNDIDLGQALGIADEVYEKLGEDFIQANGHEYEFGECRGSAVSAFNKIKQAGFEPPTDDLYDATKDWLYRSTAADGPPSLKDTVEFAIGFIGEELTTPQLECVGAAHDKSTGYYNNNLTMFVRRNSK